MVNPFLSPRSCTGSYRLLFRYETGFVVKKTPTQYGTGGLLHVENVSDSL